VIKLADNPPMLFPAGETVESLRGTWWLAHTKPRCEKAFAWDLHAAGIPYFLPMITRVIYSGGRKRRVMSPLFSSYVFINGGAEARHRALLTGRLCQIIPVLDQEQLTAELSQVGRVLAGEAMLDPYPFAAVGRRCRVRGGPFARIEGTVIERESVTRLVLQVSLLGQGIALQIDTDLLERIEEDLPAELASR
jgi:hypothetical protein